MTATKCRTMRWVRIGREGGNGDCRGKTPTTRSHGNFTVFRDMTSYMWRIIPGESLF